MSMKSKLIVLIGIFGFYLIVSFWYFSFSGIAHCDGYWYLKLAENIACGKGLIEDVVVYFYPKHPILEKFPHPVGTYWNPLSSIILAGIYRIFGISTFTSRLGVLVIDAFVIVFIFLFFSKFYSQNIWIAIVSSIIFIIHPFVLSMRGVSGLPESYDLLFITLFCYFTYKSLDGNDKNLLLAGLFGGLSYLSRNEGIWTLPTMVCVFLLSKYFIKKKNLKLKMLVFGVIVFILTISPWEVRNILIFGLKANEMKRNLLLAIEYFDVWKYGKIFSLKEYFSLGFTNLVLRRIAAFYYKAITFMDIISWPLGMFILCGIAANLKKILYLPVYVYFLVTYICISLLFPASQYSAFHSPGTLLAFFIPLSISGIFYFSSSVTKTEKVAKILGIFISSLLILFYALAHLKTYKDTKGTFYNKDKIVSNIIYGFAKRNNALNDVFMIHEPTRFHYYTNLKMVQTPMDNSFDIVKHAMKKYNCKYLILVGHVPLFFSDLYRGKKSYSELKLVYEEELEFVTPVTGGGNKIKIYQILLNN